MNAAGSVGRSTSAESSKDALVDSGITTLERATAMDRQGELEEAFTLYEVGIDLLLKGAKQEPIAHRRQTLLRELSTHMSRAENIKAVLAPVESPSPVSRSHTPVRGGGVAVRGPGRGVGQGRAAVSRPKPSASGTTGTTRGGVMTRTPPGRSNQSLGSASGGASRPNAASARNPKSPRTARVSGGGGGGGVRSPQDESMNSELEEKILEEMLDGSPGVSWDSIAGLGHAKQTLQETVILPNIRPDLFTGLRAPARGVLLYGPPGTGKTMLAKAVATESGYSFFNISASSLTSKFVGEGEKMVRALFSMARKRQPAVIFIDEIDSVLSARGETEHEASRRLKTEFLVQLDGVGRGGGDGASGEGQEDRLLVLAATNLPQELDEAALRRLSRRVYVPLPDPQGRRALLLGLLGQHKADLNSSQLSRLVHMTDGYSGSDLKQLCKEAAMQPIRDLGASVRTIAAGDVRGINLDDFKAALPRARPSVSKKTVEKYEEWENSLAG